MTITIRARRLFLSTFVLCWLSLQAVLSHAAPDGLYSLSEDPSVVVRVQSTSNGDLQLTAEQLGTIKIPQLPGFSEIEVHAARFLNGRYGKSSSKPGNFEKKFEKNTAVLGDEFFVFLSYATDGIRVSWIKFPDSMQGGGFTKRMLLTPLSTPPGDPGLERDLAGRWLSGDTVVELFDSDSGLIMFRSKVGSLVEWANEEQFSQVGNEQSFIGPVYMKLEVQRHDQLKLTVPGNSLVLRRDANTPGLPYANQRLGMARTSAGGETLVHQAVINGDLQALNRAIASGQVDLNLRSSSGLTALHLAVDRGNHDMVRALLQRGVNTSLTDNMGNTPLQLAVTLNDVQMLQTFKQNGINLYPVAEAAVGRGDIATVRTLISVGVTAEPLAKAAIMRKQFGVLEEILLNQPQLATNELYLLALSDTSAAQTVLSYATAPTFDFDKALNATASLKRTELIPDLLQGGAKPDVAVVMAINNKDLRLLSELIEVYGAKPELGYEAVITTNNKEALDLLLLNGADPSMGMIPAVQMGRTALVATLIEAGADASAPGFLQVAVTKRYPQLVKLLLESGGSGVDGQLLQTAVVRKDARTAELLIDHGAPVQQAVVSAVSGGSEAVVNLMLARGGDFSDPRLLVDAVSAPHRVGALRALLANGGDPNTRDASGTPLFVLAAEKGSTDTLAALMMANVNKEAADANGNRAIHKAVTRKKDELEIVKFLIESGVDLNAENSQGKKPRNLASGIRVPWALRGAGAKK